jgi:hypothetical protein
MAKPTKAEVKRILGALRRSKKKFVTLEALSRLVGLYPDVLAETLAYFEPMIRMDPSINTRDLVPALEEYLKEPMKPVASNPKPKKIAISKKELAEYSSIADFVYKKMTNVGGLVDTSKKLSDEELRILEKLVQRETQRRRKAK